ncbi:uncharacterized protein LOC134256083 [Saccostrea cucullata]|uniref:uncharacterized protein LOC134256083 n=1 Tax=Saccostrea cuccullata TaxID=36930 RepID=UPI002ED2FD68
MHLKEEYAFITILFFGAFLGFSDGSCVLPWAGVWYDSAFPDNDVTFDNSSQSVLGWKIQAYSTEGTNWVCLEESQVDNKLLFRSLTNFGIFSIPIFMFRCIRWTKISDDAYLYYVLADEQTNIANQRLYAEASDTNLTIETACSATNPPETNEFHVIVRKGRESSARQNCPSLLLHNFTYIHDNGTMTSCDPANGSADGCSNRQQIEFDFSQCNTAVGFSAGGVYYCLHSETVGPVQYALTITPESVDYQKTFKFTCFVLQQSGSYIYASDTKGSCKRTQSPFSKETDGTGFLKLLSFGK